jgi:hypothetical protein
VHGCPRRWFGERLTKLSLVLQVDLQRKLLEEYEKREQKRKVGMPWLCTTAEQLAPAPLQDCQNPGLRFEMPLTAHVAARKLLTNAGRL